MKPRAFRTPAEDPLRIFDRLMIGLYSRWISMTYPFSSVGANLAVHYSCDWGRGGARRIMLGNSVQIRKDATLQIVGQSEDHGEPIIIIDDGCCLGPRCEIRARNRVHIERDVLIGQSVLITDYNCPSPDRAIGQQMSGGGRIQIGEGSWVGYRAAILCTQGELVLGRNCVVAANAVVTRSFPAHSVIFGNPARAIRQFDAAKNSWVLKPA